MRLLHKLGNNFKVFVTYCILLTIGAVFLNSGCTGKAAPPIDNTAGLPQAQMSIDSIGLTISSRALDSPSIVSVQAQSFNNWEEFFSFAEKTLGAKRIYDDNGRTIAVTGEYTLSGEIIFRDSRGNLFKQYDFISAYLGGSDGKFRIGDKEINFNGQNNDSTIALFNTSDENCNGPDCVTGESWLTHRGIYHSVGCRTNQSSGGFRILSYQCCSGGGQMVTINGRKKCQAMKPGSWEYDYDLGRLVPTTTDPNVYSDPRICYRQTFNNLLGINMRLIYGANNIVNIELQKENTIEIEKGFWLLELFIFDAGDQDIDEIIGVCGFHFSNRGGSVQTSDGWTGNNDVLCDLNTF